MKTLIAMRTLTTGVVLPVMLMLMMMTMVLGKAFDRFLSGTF